MKLSQHFLDKSKVDVGFAAKKLLKERKLSELQVATFYLGCWNILATIVEKLVEICLLKFSVVCSLLVLDSTFIIHKTNPGISRVGTVPAVLHAANCISHIIAEKSKQQYTALNTAVHNDFKALFQCCRTRLLSRNKYILWWYFDGQQEFFRPVACCQIYGILFCLIVHFC